jgi:hypothetical protein
MKKRYPSFYRLNHNFINNSKLRLKLVPTKINPVTQEKRGWTYKKQRNCTRLTQLARNKGTNPNSGKKKSTGRGFRLLEGGGEGVRGDERRNKEVLPQQRTCVGKK